VGVDRYASPRCGVSLRRRTAPACLQSAQIDAAATVALARLAAGWGLATARGGLGRLQGVEEALWRIDAQAESFKSVLHHAVVVATLWLRGLVLAGLLDRADRGAWRYRERCQDTPGPGEVITSVMCAYVAMSRGQVRTAARWYRHAFAGIRDADLAACRISGWGASSARWDGG
jgi:hypothetical protein